jgi:ATP synthase protein I
MRSKEKSGKFDFLWASSWGLVLVISTALGLAIGVYLDARLSSGPVLTVTFLVLGIAAGFWQIIKEIIKLGASGKKK